MEMGSFRKEFSEEKKFTLLSLYFFPLLPCLPPHLLSALCSIITIISGAWSCVFAFITSFYLFIFFCLYHF